MPLREWLGTPRLNTSRRPWPQVVKIESSTDVGTGVVVGPDVLVTARHIFDKSDKCRISTQHGRVADSDIITACPEADVAIVKTKQRDAFVDIAPARLIHVSDLPVAYETWGFRSVDGKTFECLCSGGIALANNQGWEIQLLDAGIRSGMSGAGLAIDDCPVPFIIAVATGRHSPRHPAEVEDLSFADSVGAVSLLATSLGIPIVELSVQEIRIGKGLRRLLRAEMRRLRGVMVCLVTGFVIAMAYHVASSVVTSSLWLYAMTTTMLGLLVLFVAVAMWRCYTRWDDAARLFELLRVQESARHWMRYVEVAFGMIRDRKFAERLQGVLSKTYKRPSISKGGKP